MGRRAILTTQSSSLVDDVVELNSKLPAPATRQPAWIPEHIPELDGLRGIAILAVFLYHAKGRLVSTWIDPVAAWGWAGVSLFFVLSGYLITTILISTRNKPHYFRNFYARRILRVWPVYFLMMGICFLGPHWLLSLPLGVSKWKAAVAVLLFVQNIVPAQICEFGALGPTWSLAIEEQYYLLWAPIVRFIHRRSYLVLGLSAIFLLSPILRLKIATFVKPTHTLLHLDCIILGSLLALALLSLKISRKQWLYIGASLAIAGFVCLATWAHGTVFADSSIALAFSGVVLLAISGSGSSLFPLRILRSTLLRFFGKISYGFYMTHMAIFMGLSLLYESVDKSAIAGTIGANLLIIAVQFLLCTLAAALLWYGLERRVLKLKRYF